MQKNVKEIRQTTGMSQQEFAKMYGIPLSTLRNWGQGINSPAPYIRPLIS